MPKFDLIYEPRDVVAVLELKYSGIYNSEVVPRLKTVFDNITSEHQHIQCAYVTIMERSGFKHAATEEALGDKVSTLHLWSGAREKAEQTGDWEKLLAFLKQMAL